MTDPTEQVSAAFGQGPYEEVPPFWDGNVSTTNDPRYRYTAREVENARLRTLLEEKIGRTPDPSRSTLQLVQDLAAMPSQAPGGRQ